MTAMRIPGGVATRIALVVTLGMTASAPELRLTAGRRPSGAGSAPGAPGYMTLAASAPAMSSAAR